MYVRHASSIQGSHVTAREGRQIPHSFKPSVQTSGEAGDLFVLFVCLFVITLLSIFSLYVKIHIST